MKKLKKVLFRNNKKYYWKEGDLHTDAGVVKEEDFDKFLTAYQLKGVLQLRDNFELLEGMEDKERIDEKTLNKNLKKVLDRAVSLSGRQNFERAKEELDVEEILISKENQRLSSTLLKEEAFMAKHGQRRDFSYENIVRRAINDMDIDNWLDSPEIKDRVLLRQLVDTEHVDNTLKRFNTTLKTAINETLEDKDNKETEEIS